MLQGSVLKCEKGQGSHNRRDLRSRVFHACDNRRHNRRVGSKMLYLQRIDCKRTCPILQLALYAHSMYEMRRRHIDHMSPASRGYHERRWPSVSSGSDRGVCPPHHHRRLHHKNVAIPATKFMDTWRYKKQRELIIVKSVRHAPD